MKIGLPKIKKFKSSSDRNAGMFKAFALMAFLLVWASAGVAQGEGSSPRAVADGHEVSVSAAEKAAAPAAIDAPQPQLAAEDVAPTPAADAVPMDEPGGYRVAPLHKKYILPDMRAQPLTVRGKIVIGLQDVYSPTNFGGMIVAAGYEQVRNGQPNYGTDRGAFGERLGAAGIRDSAQGFLTDGVFAPLLHEDPRYYVEGSQYGVVHRALYAVTRPLITRTDRGHKALNGALLLGYACTSLLNNAYYPQMNRNVKDTAEGFAGSIGGSALGFVLSEFTAGLWDKLHLGHGLR